MPLIPAILILIAAFAGVVGWIWNILKLVGVESFTGNEVEVIIRAIGLFAAPIGAVMGYL